MCTYSLLMANIIYKFRLVSIPSKAIFPISPLLGRSSLPVIMLVQRMMPSVCMHGHKGGDGRECTLLFSQLFRYPSSWSSSVQFSSVAKSCPILCDPMNCSTSGLPVHYQLAEFTQSHVHRVSDAIQPSHPSRPLLLLPPIPPSIRVFSNESALHMRWPKYWSFSFSIIPSKEITGLILFRMDWLDFLAVQGALRSLFQHHSSKASVLRHSAFFTVQLSNPYMTTAKTIALTRRTFVDKVMSVLLNISRSKILSS